MSVGSQGNFVGFGTPVLTTLTQEWNGISWATVPSPNPATASNAELTDVSCISTSFCMAVGWATFGSGLVDSPLAEQWNGTSWSMTTLTGLATTSGLNAVSCTSATSCVAVGFSGPLRHLEWRRLEHGHPPVACVAPMKSSLTGLALQCEHVLHGGRPVVGVRQRRWQQLPLDHTLTEEWTNNTWSIIPSPKHLLYQVPLARTRLVEVSCIGSSFSGTAVGDGFHSGTPGPMST